MESSSPVEIDVFELHGVSRNRGFGAGADREQVADRSGGSEQITADLETKSEKNDSWNSTHLTTKSSLSLRPLDRSF